MLFWVISEFFSLVHPIGDKNSRARDRKSWRWKNHHVFSTWKIIKGVKSQIFLIRISKNCNKSFLCIFLSFLWVWNAFRQRKYLKQLRANKIHTLLFHIFRAIFLVITFTHHHNHRHHPPIIIIYYYFLST